MSLGARWLGILAESLILLLSFAAAVLVRLGSVGDAARLPSLSCRRRSLCMVAVQLTLYYAELYEYRSRRRIELFQQLGQCMAIAAVALAFIFFAVPGLEVGRGIFSLFVAARLVGAAAVAAVPAVGLGHARGLRRPRADPGHRRPRAEGRARDAEARADRLPRAGLPDRARGRGRPHARATRASSARSPTCRGSPSRSTPTLIVVAQEDRRKRLPVDLLLRCRMAGVRVVEAASLFEELSGRIPLRDLRPSWLIFSGGFHKPRVLASVKRVGEA